MAASRIGAPADTSITITLNGRASLLARGSSLAMLLAHHPDTCALPADGIASAVNGSFVARARRASHVLQDGDAVTVFQAIVGG